MPPAQPTYRPMGRFARRGAAGSLTAAAALWLLAPPAAADPPQPGDFSSSVTDTQPSTDVFEVCVVGGDSLVELHADSDHEVVVLGYDDEPYLRFRPDGSVEENANSPTKYANTDRYGNPDIPEDADDEAEPDWRRVDDDSSFAWHDHRVHWMSPSVPDGVERGEVVQEWSLPLEVDGERVTVQGELVLEPDVTWWPWLVVGVLTAAAIWVASRWLRAADAVALTAVGVAGTLGVAVSLAEQLSIPSDAGRRLLPVILPAIGLVCTSIGVVLRRHRTGEVFSLGAIALVASWALLRLDVFTKPVIPTDLSPGLDRAGTAMALGLAAGAAAVAVTRARPVSQQPEAEAPAAPEQLASS